MRKLFTHMFNTRKVISRSNRRGRLGLESLESRELPAITIQIDYSHDTSGFFTNNPAAQAALQQAANALGSQLSASLPAITPGGGNTWQENFIDPSTGQVAYINNPTVAANTIVVYAGARSLGGTQVSQGGTGGYSASGTQDWVSSLPNRGPLGALLWGGSVSFDTNTNWYFGSSSTGLQSNQEDFISAAEHELGHVLGFGTVPTWFAQVSNGTFTGAHSEAVYGGPVPLTWGSGEELANISVNGTRPDFNLTLPVGMIAGTPSSPMTALDWAILEDIGWQVGSSPAQPVSVESLPTATAPTTTSPVATPASPSAPTAAIISGLSGGTAQTYALNSSGQLVANGSVIDPFPGFTGVVRSTVADFNGDGTPDYAFVTGAGTAAEVVIINGKTGMDLVAPTTILSGFTGGAFVAAGDISGTGRADLVVSADAGGGPRVEVFQIANGQLVTVADFVAFGSPDFRGGARVAVGDVNHDGYADLIVGAGVGGGPRVSVYSGKALANGQLVNLVPDFFAFDPSLRSGVYVTAGDFNGDGYADIAYSTGNTGGPRVEVISGAVLVANPGVNVANLPPLANFYALDPNDRTGLRIGTINMPGQPARMIVANGSLTNPEVRILNLADMQSLTGPMSSIQNPLAGVSTVDGYYVG